MPADFGVVALVGASIGISNVLVNSGLSTALIQTKEADETDYSTYSKSDFNELLELNMKKEGTFLYFYNHLRALSHGEYKNAYFIDPKSGKKIYIKLDIDY